MPLVYVGNTAGRRFVVGLPEREIGCTPRSANAPVVAVLFGP
ncbi:hypothetical protein OG223_17835 [Streptomyces sp. NBC_01478]|nr:hypothetical protein [Streptomyces sp. NBC_01478]